ncbi:hypothetical protein ABFO80_12370 [Acinetobacter towneri]|jgi:hypothetical protein|uniref:hypothetical protein n=1 Tax=Acinetobacter towneri TaxID=202956 RepID=UPI003213ECC9
MSPEVFIEDFERTENSDYLHGVLGRSLIIATRFDAMCIGLSQAIDIKFGRITYHSDDEFKELIQKVISEYRTLHKSIKAFGLPQELSEILHKARESRNEIAHSLTKGLSGCIDNKIENTILINKITELIGNITEGDILISTLISYFNNDPILNTQSMQKYKNRVIDWVITP